MSGRIPNSLSFSSFFLLLLVLSSMQAPSQNSPLCAYQPSGPAQSSSTATNTPHLLLCSDQEQEIPEIWLKWFKGGAWACGRGLWRFRQLLSFKQQGERDVRGVPTFFTLIAVFCISRSPRLSRVCGSSRRVFLLVFCLVFWGSTSC